MTLKQLEKIVIEHLKESGEIRSDIKWLKRAFWALVTEALILTGMVVIFGLGRLWK